MQKGSREPFVFPFHLERRMIMTLGQKIFRAMYDKGTSPYGVSRKTGILSSEIEEFMNDKKKPDFESMIKIADALDMEAKDFISDEDEYVVNLSNLDVERLSYISKWSGRAYDQIITDALEHEYDKDLGID